MNTPIVPLVVAAALAVSFSASADWPQWRGPNRDAVVKDPNHKLEKLPAEPKVLWKIDAGPGQSSPVVAGGKLVFLDAQNDQETAHCVDAASGKILWSTPVGPTVEFSPAYGGGPRCTPLIDGDRVYAQSSGGEFRCLALADGKKIWGVSFGSDYGATFIGNKSGDPAAKETASRRHGNNGCAVIDGDRIFVPVGSVNDATLVCFDKKTGKELWHAGTDNTAYSSVMFGTLAGVKQAVHFTADALMGVDAANGKILWRVPLKTGAKRHACTPVISGDTVTVASTSIGTQKFKIVKNGAEFVAEKAWENSACKTILGTPTLVGKNMFTIGPTDRTDLQCLDFETGNQLWAQKGLSDYASLTVVNDRILVLNSTGELLLVKADPAKYEELGRVQLCAKTWASPAYLDGNIFVKDEAHLTALSLAD
ncbi:MAG: PQQ-binding-like beta-propeller repeat protein [Chthoniobacteraceae bacterium]